ncbi:MAG: hypothetical protein WC795_00435 [Candidatus Paceibacterota bacterium]|jgi:hypothetical protein
MSHIDVTEVKFRQETFRQRNLFISDRDALMVKISSLKKRLSASDEKDKLQKEINFSQGKLDKLAKQIYDLSDALKLD